MPEFGIWPAVIVKAPDVLHAKPWRNRRLDIGRKEIAGFGGMFEHSQVDMEGALNIRGGSAHGDQRAV